MAQVSSTPLPISSPSSAYVAASLSWCESRSASDTWPTRSSASSCATCITSQLRFALSAQIAQQANGAQALRVRQASPLVEDDLLDAERGSGSPLSGRPGQKSAPPVSTTPSK